MHIRRIAAVIAMVSLSTTVSAAQSTTAKVVRAANAFLTTLDTAQRRKVSYAFTDDEQRRRWSNFPTGFVPRGGIDLHDMTATQRTAALALMSTVLSARGYEKVQQIMAADEAFKTTAASGRGRGGPPNAGPPGGGRRGGPPNGGPPGGGRGPGGDAAMFGADLYYISFLGTPSETAPWMLQYGGHHLALNITIAGERGVLTPTLTGAQPSLFTLDGKTVRPLAGESDKALALLNTLDASQRAQAILKYDISDLVLGPGEDGKTILPEGMKVSTMNAKQRAMLLDVINEWAGIINDASAAPRMKQLTAELDQTYFAWSGATTAAPGQNITGYYRIQGPHLVIEFAPQRDDPALHVHTIYRDPTNDYGRGMVGK